MKINIKKIGLAVLILCAISISKVHAQDTQFGVKGGLSLYSLTYNVSAFGLSVEQTSDKKIGITAGVFAEKPYSDLISGKIEALYIQKGGKDNNVEDFGDGNLTLSYIDVPVLLQVNIPMESDLRPFVYGGGFAGYLLNASADSDEQNTEDVEIKEYLKNINYGLLIGAGVSFGKLSFDIRYDLGLANLFDESSVEDELEEVEDVEGFGDFSDLLSGFEIATSGFMFTAGITF